MSWFPCVSVYLILCVLLLPRTDKVHLPAAAVPCVPLRPDPTSPSFPLSSSESLTFCPRLPGWSPVHLLSGSPWVLLSFLHASPALSFLCASLL